VTPERGSDVHIDWATLGTIASVAAAATVTVVLLVTFALVASSDVDRAGDGGASGPRPAGRALGVLCLLAVALIVGYGLYLIVA
jgi:hypothetical protein